MASNPFEGLASGLATGMQIGQNAQKLDIAREEQRQQAIAAKFNRLKEMRDSYLKQFESKNVAPSYKKDLWNGPYREVEKVLSNFDAPLMDKWPLGPGEEYAATLQGLQKDLKEGRLDRKAFKINVALTNAKFAGMIGPGEMEEVTKHILPKVTPVEHASGPGGQKTTSLIDEQGNVEGTLGSGTPQPPSGGSANDIRTKAIDDIRDALRIKASLKQTGWAEIGAMWPKRWRKPTTKEQMESQLNTNMALRAQDLGFDKETTQKLLDGTIDLEAILSQTTAPSPAPAPAPQQKGGTKPAATGPIHTYPSGKKVMFNGKEWVPYNG